VRAELELFVPFSFPTHASKVSASAHLPVPLPEIPFGNNELRLEHAPSQFSIKFDALEALQHVDGTGEETGTVQVAYADDWKRSRQALDVDKIQSKRWDWTYSTTYAGSQVSAGTVPLTILRSILTKIIRRRVHEQKRYSSLHQEITPASPWPS
jgi:hypothetical protein